MLTVSATHLARLAAEDACPRCFWLRHCVKRLPFEVFAGVVPALDRLSKAALKHWTDDGIMPPWLRKFGEHVEHIDPPHWSKFYFTREQLQIRGQADAIARLQDKSLLIVDLKTATYTPRQEQVLPIYAAQLGCYALSAEERGLGQVSNLVLVYCQPAPDAHDIPEGFAVHFYALAMAVNRNDERVYGLCEKALKILSGTIPDPSPSCEDCQALRELQRAQT